MKTFLRASAIIEIPAGIALLFFPAIAMEVLLGTSVTPAGLLICRLAGAALISLGFVCWKTGGDVHSPAAKGIMTAMLFYNVVAVLALLYGALALQLTGIGLYPAIALHVAMVIWWGYAYFKK